MAPLVALALFGYAVWYRTHGITESFSLRGDQIRDWSIALRAFADLPLSGVPSTAGGSTIGPAYYWFLWAVARTLGPFADYLPHAGGVGIALAHSATDAGLFLALRRRFDSSTLPLALVGLIVTAPYDAALSATIWNPPVAEALAKLSIALILWKPEISLGRGIAAAAAAWGALHCHTGAVVVVGPVLLYLVAQPFRERRVRVALRHLAATILSVVALQIPWLITRARGTGDEDNRVVSSIRQVLSDPAASLDLQASIAFIGKSLEFLIFAPLAIPHFPAVFLALVAVTVIVIRDAALLATCVGPVLASIGAFAILQGGLTEVYWCLVLSAPATVAAFGWINHLRREWRHAITLTALVALVASQPVRAAIAWNSHRVPEYGAIVRGCRQIISDSRAVREIGVTFALPYDTNPAWLFSILGGTLTAGPETSRATIDADGFVRYD